MKKRIVMAVAVILAIMAMATMCSPTASAGENHRGNDRGHHGHDHGEKGHKPKHNDDNCEETTTTTSTTMATTTTAAPTTTVVTTTTEAPTTTVSPTTSTTTAPTTTVIPNTTTTQVTTTTTPSGAETTTTTTLPLVGVSDNPPSITRENVPSVTPPTRELAMTGTNLTEWPLFIGCILIAIGLVAIGLCRSKGGEKLVREMKTQ